MSRTLIAICVILCAQISFIKCKGSKGATDKLACMSMADQDHLTKALVVMHDLHADTWTTCLKTVGKKFGKACRWAKSASAAVLNAYKKRHVAWMKARKTYIKRAMESFSDPKFPKWTAPNCQKTIKALARSHFYRALKFTCDKFAAHLATQDKAAIAAGKTPIIPKNMKKRVGGKMVTMGYICSVFGRLGEKLKKKKAKKL